MQQVIRPYITAGVSIVGAGLIVVTPVARPLPDLREVRSADVALTADFDPTAAFNAFSDNLSTLTQAGFAPGPMPALQQLIVNLGGYTQGLIDGTSDFNDVLTAMGNNLSTVLQSIALINAPDDVINDTIAMTIGGNHGLLHTALTDGVSGIIEPPAAPIPAIINFLSSPLSGVFIAAVGPLVAPLVPFLNPFMDILGAAANGGTPDMAQALQDLVQAPLKAIPAFLNGDTLNLDVLIPLLVQGGLLPEGTTINGVDFGFGGLFSSGAVSGVGASPTLTVGGSIFNSLGLDITAHIDVGGTPVPVPIDAVAAPVGPIGELESLGILVAHELGAWAGKNGDTLPPLGQFHFPTLPTGDDTAAALSGLSLGDFDLSGLFNQFGDLLNGLPGADLIGDLMAGLAV